MNMNIPPHQWSGPACVVMGCTDSEHFLAAAFRIVSRNGYRSPK